MTETSHSVYHMEDVWVVPIQSARRRARKPVEISAMNKKSRAALDHGAASDLWRHTFSQIPCVFGRLVYLASLLNSNTGRYEHHGLALVFGDDEANQTLCSSHEQAFREWLSFNLEQQKADLDLYLANLGVDRRTILNTWIRLTPYRNLVPASAQSQERRLFFADIEALLGLLKNEYGVVVQSPDA